MSMRSLIGDVVLSGTASGAGVTSSGPLVAGGGVAHVLLLVHVTAVSGTSPSLAVAIEQSADGSSWAAVPGGAAGTLSGVGNTSCSARISQNFARVTATVAGTTPAVTFTVAAVVFAE